MTPTITPIPTPPRSRFTPPLATIARSYPAQHDAPLEVEHRPGNGMLVGGSDGIRRRHPEGDPATAKQTVGIIGTAVLSTLLLIAFVLLMVVG